jgi:hypothetical protein
MLIDNRTTWAARAWPVSLADGADALVVAVKAAFTQAPGSTTWRETAAPAWIEADVFTGDAATSAPLRETDFTPTKPACDVIVVGHAHPPPNDPTTTRFTAGLRCGPIDKAWSVVGARTWQRRLFGWRTSEPQPLAPVPLHYGSAFGGADLLHPDETRRRVHQANPAGCGFFGDAPKNLVIEQALPAFEAIEDPPRSPEVEHRAVAAGVIGRTWHPRRVLAGTYDDTWQEQRAPFLPEDFSPAYFNSAPPDQQMPFPAGGEEFDLANLTSDGWWTFALPALAETTEIFPLRGASLAAALVVDTVVIEPDLRCVTMTARATIPLTVEIEAIERVVIGPVSAGWRTARSLGKRWRPHAATPAGAAR